MPENSDTSLYSQKWMTPVTMHFPATGEGSNCARAHCLHIMHRQSPQSFFVWRIRRCHFSCWMFPSSKIDSIWNLNGSGSGSFPVAIRK